MSMVYTFPVKFQEPVKVEQVNTQLNLLPPRLISIGSNGPNIVGDPYYGGSHQDRKNPLNIFVPENRIWTVLSMFVFVVPKSGGSTSFCPTIGFSHSGTTFFFTQGMYSHTNTARQYIINCAPNIIDSDDTTGQPGFRYSRRTVYGGPLLPDDCIFFDEWDGNALDNWGINLLVNETLF